jgi:2-phosphoglycerate kinase
MLYILSGIAKSGKSYITQKIVKEYGIGAFSSDYLMMSLARANKDLGINPNSSDVTVSRQLRPYLDAMIRTMIENKIDYLLEGVHFQPEFIHNLMDLYPGKIKVVYLGYRLIPTATKRQELKQFGPATENHWYHAMDDEALFFLVEYLKNESENLYQQCQSLNLKYVEIHSITSQASEIIDFLMS